MIKFFFTFLILLLIFFTAFIKNSTKRIDDQTFTVKENIKGHEKDFENIKLEHDYLSSAEKLLQFQSMYFDDELVKKDIQNIKVIDDDMNNFNIVNFPFIFIYMKNNLITNA